MFSILGSLNVSVVVLLAGIGGLIAYGTYLQYEVRYWDRRIDALCAEDGGKNVGLRVYERVMAPESYIKPASGAAPGYIQVPWRYEGKAAKPDEPFVEETVVLETVRADPPRVYKYAVRITRVSDEKVLAEQIMFRREGGGIPMPDPSEVKSCPEEEKSAIGTNALFNKVFINHPLNRPSEKP